MPSLDEQTLGLEIAEAIFQSGLQPSTASLANGVPPPPSTARGSEPLGRRGGRKE
ncbi:hypothetical protein [Archangium violaceum]|uniref:hypothetical protein n=1 Tax=Archangium violaceum TaxID=83451 RepID=UPI0036DCC9D1